MKTILEDGRIKLECSDWRYGAAILGLIRYFDDNFLDYEIKDDSIIYDKSNINKENFVKYILTRYKDYHFAYIDLVDSLSKETYTEDEIKDMNKKLSSPKPIESLNLHFDGTNQEDLLKILEENKEKLVLDIFKNRKNNGYIMYCNPSCLFEPDNNICRVNGFYVDTNLKKNLLSWNTDNSTFESEDIQEFDFITFGFSMDKVSIFVNNNFSINSLLEGNNHFKNQSGILSLYKYISELGEKNIYNNIEVIIKEQGKTYYQNLYIEKSLIDKLKLIKEINNISILEKLKIEIRKDVFIDFNYILTLIFNRQHLDNIIMMILKNRKLYEQYRYYLQFLIQINMILNGKELNKMKLEYKGAYACAKEIVDKLDDNKLNVYRQKLISSIAVNNKENVYNILLQLSNYSHVNINFMFDILDDYNGNKDKLYVFVSALVTDKKNEKEEVKKND